jgi:hypothetical protein
MFVGLNSGDLVRVEKTISKQLFFLVDFYVFFKDFNDCKC